MKQHSGMGEVFFSIAANKNYKRANGILPRVLKESEYVGAFWHLEETNAGWMPYNLLDATCAVTHV